MTDPLKNRLNRVGLILIKLLDFNYLLTAVARERFFPWQPCPSAVLAPENGHCLVIEGCRAIFKLFAGAVLEVRVAIPRV